MATAKLCCQSIHLIAIGHVAAHGATAAAILGAFARQGIGSLSGRPVGEDNLVSRRSQAAHDTGTDAATATGDKNPSLMHQDHLQ